MSLFERMKGWFGADAKANGRATLGVDELARRLGMSVEALRSVRPNYRQFSIPKRTGGQRTIHAPDEKLKATQRVILRRLLRRLAVHPAACGFERGRSIVTNALPHVNRALVLRMDIKDFFGATSARRVQVYFQHIGWNREATQILLNLCTHRGALPQGAPTSPRLSNLVNYRLDARLTNAARKYFAVYTRYADDLTFSFAEDLPEFTHLIIRLVKQTLADEGYEMHTRKKLHLRRRHDRQLVTGLVVNQSVKLPRRTRRWLRSVEHHLRSGHDASLTPTQLDGWRSLQRMIEQQTESENSTTQHR